MLNAALLRDPDIDPGPAIPAEKMTLDQLITAANYGEPEAVALLEERMRQDPNLTRERGSLTRQLLAQMLNSLESNHDVHTQLTPRFLEELSSQLVRPEAPVLERIMGERVLLAYVNLHLVHYLQLSVDEPQIVEATSPDQRVNLLRRLDSAYLNLDVALKGLRELSK